MKNSSYIKFIIDGEHLFLCNLFSEAVLDLPKSAKQLVEHILQYPDVDYEDTTAENIKKMLVDGGFLIMDDFDELTGLKKRFAVSQAGRNNFSIQVAVTLQCNFRCPYCYESHDPIVLSQKKQDALIAFIKNNIHKWQKLNFSWFGGEPLLYPNIIEYLSNNLLKICRENGVGFEGFITTNGYLLNQQTAEMLKRCRIKEAQITLDGDRETHNRRRFLVGGQGTFDRILENIFLAKDYLDGFRIRVNVDSQSVDNMKKVISLLLPIKEKVLVAFLPVQQVKGYCNKTLSYKEFRQKVNSLNDLTSQMGFRVAPGHRLSGATYCGAYNEQYFLLDPRGDIHKCVVMTGRQEFRVGVLTDQGEVKIDDASRQRWGFNPFQDLECQQCECLPICMGGCQNLPVGQKRASGRCAIKDNLERNLLMLLRTGHKKNLIGKAAY